MATTPIQTIKNWFLTGLKPTQAQFHAWMDSFWHKNEMIPTDKIDGLEGILNGKASTLQLANKVDKVDNHSLLSDTEIERLLTIQNQDLSLKADLVNGVVPANQLPSYVDDVLEGTYINPTTFNNPVGVAYVVENGKVYVDTTSNITYRWSGSAYVAIGSSLALGETSQTAYRGDRGVFAFNYAVAAISSGIEFLVGQIARLRIIWFGGFTIAQRNAIVNPQEGMLVYINQDPKEFQIYQDGSWLPLGTNISNANLTNLTARTFTLNASFTWATLGNPFRITGLTNSLEPDRALVLNTSKEIREVQIINLAEIYTGVTYPTNQFLIDNYPLAEIVKCPNTPIPRQYTKLGLVWAHFNLTLA